MLFFCLKLSERKLYGVYRGFIFYFSKIPRTPRTPRTNKVLKPTDAVKMYGRRKQNPVQPRTHFYHALILSSMHSQSQLPQLTI